MRKNKKIKRLILTIVILGVLVGGAFVLKGVLGNKEVDVYSVSLLNQAFFEESGQMSGTVASGKIQKVTLRKGIVNELKVKDGDRVKKGDVLMVYDESSFKLTLQSDEANIAVLEAGIAQNRRDIRKYSGLKPSEDRPEPHKEIIDHGPLKIMDKLTEAEVGKEELNVSLQTEITPQYLGRIRENEDPISLNLYEDEVLYGTYCIEGADIPEKVESYEEYVPEQKTVEPLYRKVSVDPLNESWRLENIIFIEEDGAGSLSGTGYDYYGSFKACVPTPYERYEEIIYDDSYYDEGEDYVYTKAELAEMIRQKQSEIKELELDLKAARVTYEQDKLIGSTGEVKAEVDGVITDCKKIADLKEGDTVFSVKGEGSYTIQFYIGEMDLANVAKGDTVTGTAYETGDYFTGVVEEISEKPASDDSGSYGYYGSANPNNSWYPVTAIVQEEDLELNVGEGCTVTLDKGSQEQQTIYLPLMYVRNDKGGSYVMKDVEGRLVKQYVKTGSNIYGYIMEVLSGINEEDYVAFPYDAGEKEGNKTVKNEEMPGV